jgi:predicted transcriptional regulator
MYTLNINQRFWMPDTELTLKLAKEIKEKLDKLSLIRKKSSEDLAEEAISQYLDLELWRHEQIIQGVNESMNNDYADEETIKRVFKKNVG